MCCDCFSLSENAISVHGIQIFQCIGADSWNRELPEQSLLCLNIPQEISKIDAITGINYSIVTKFATEFLQQEFHSVEYALNSLAMEIIKVFDVSVAIRLVKPRGILTGDFISWKIFRSKDEPFDKQTFYPGDEICCSGVSVLAIIGINSWERQLEQKIVVDFTLKPEKQAIVPNDYNRICNSIVSTLKLGKYSTIEVATEATVKSVVANIAENISAIVSVQKPFGVTYAASAGFQVIMKAPRKGRHAWISLGSNHPNKKRIMHQTVLRLGSFLRVTKMSRTIETEPVNTPDRFNKYLNAVVEVETEIEPLELCKQLKQLEKEMGREEGTIIAMDCDILMYENVVNIELSIPRPGFEKLDFCIIPLCE